MEHDLIVHDVHDANTGTWQYIVADPSTSAAAVIDSVLDYDPSTASISTSNADKLLAIVKSHNYNVGLILDTHAHADHLTAAAYLQHCLGSSQGNKPSIGIGKRIVEVQKHFGEKYGISRDEYENAFDKLLEDDEEFAIGSLTGVAVHLPGHTPDHMGYKIKDNIFCGDSLFNADIGSARCDFPGGEANQLYSSVQKILSLPSHVKVYTGHDYPPESRAPVSSTTVKEHQNSNKHLKVGVTQDEFVTWRTARDATLKEPRLIHYAMQHNIRAGHLPRVTAAGDRLLHVPMKLSVPAW